MIVLILCTNKTNVKTKDFHSDDKIVCQYFHMFILDPVLDSLVLTTLLLAETIIIYSYNSRILRSFGNCFQLVFKTFS